MHLFGVLLQTTNPLTFDGPVGDLPIVSDARWSAAFTGNSWGAFLAWVVLLVVLQAASWPLLRVLFARFPDRGWGLSRLFTALIAGWLVWFLASIPIISFRAIGAWSAVIVVSVISILLGRWLDPDRRSDWRFWKNRTILAAELVFWAVFLLFLIFRLNNPDSYHPIWGGEKAMEFAHINAILRSAHFPPVDPWYAGGYINYYYYGEYLVAFLIKLTGIPIEYAFNLAQPTVIALLAMAGFSIAAAMGRHILRVGAGTRWTIVAGLVGTFLLSIAGNLVDAARMVDRLIHGAVPVYAFGYWVWDPSRAIPFTINEFPYFTGLYADLHAHVVALPVTVAILALLYTLVLDWRAVVVTVSIPSIARRTVVSIGLRLGLLALLIGTLWPTNAWDVPMYVAMSGIALLMATRGIPVLWKRLGVAAGSLAVVGAAAYLSILPFMQHYVALFSLVKTQDANTPLVTVESHFGVFFLIIFVGFLTILSRTGRLPYPLDTPVVPLSLVGIVLLYRWWAVGRSDAAIRSADMLTVLVVIGILVAAFMLAAPERCDFGLPSFVPRLVVIAGSIGVLWLVTLDRPVPALYLGFGAVAAGLWLSLRETTERYLTAMIAGGMLLGAALEYVYLYEGRTDDWYRMNTVFKFYNQLWVLFALASAGLVARMIADARQQPVAEDVVVRDEIAVAESDAGNEVIAEETATESIPDPRRDGFVPGWSLAGLALSVVLALASLAFAFEGTPARLDQHWDQPGRTLTLDAYAWMNYGQIQFTNGDAANPKTTMVGYKDDLAAMTWLNENVHGSPVIAEAAFGAYRCNGSRFSIATGLPAVVGWSGHESQQRSNPDLFPASDAAGNPIPSREQRLRAFYTDGDVAAKREFLKQYGVEYVVVGQTEKLYPTLSGNDCVVTDTSVGMTAIQSMVGTELEVAFQQGTTTIYRVISTDAAAN